jgi:hypothetical protein
MLSVGDAKQIVQRQQLQAGHDRFTTKAKMFHDKEWMRPGAADQRICALRNRMKPMTRQIDRASQ